MKSPKSIRMEELARSYKEFAQNEAPECINRKLDYEIADCCYEEKRLTLSFKTGEWMLNPGGVVHGGMVCTMFDITMGITARVLSHYYTPTVNMSVSFLAPTPNNDNFVVTARATRVGKTFVQLTAEGRSQATGELCATATGVFFCDRSLRLEEE